MKLGRENARCACTITIEVRDDDPFFMSMALIHLREVGNIVGGGLCNDVFEQAIEELCSILDGLLRICRQLSSGKAAVY
jgi:hypothetical protein